MSSKGEREEWKTAFSIAGMFSIVGGIIYLLFARGEVQAWALDQDDQSVEVNPEKTSLISNNKNVSNIDRSNYESIIAKK